MNIPTNDQHHIVIIGGGFGGIRTILDLLDHNYQGKITLVSSSPFFSYYPAIHKIISDQKHPVCQIPLVDIIHHDRVRIIIDEVTGIDTELRQATLSDGQTISGDMLVIALGSQTEYYNIDGLAEMSFGLKTYSEANQLRNHIINLFEKHATTEKTESLIGLHMMIVGGGPSGVDLAGELAVWTKKLAKLFNVNHSLVTIDLVESHDRVLSMMPESISEHVTNHLRKLGVNVLLNRNLIKEGSWTAILDDMKIGAKTLIWTAGVRAHKLLSEISGITVTAGRGRVIVDEYLHPVKQDGTGSYEGVYVIGDSADTLYSGLAQTALHDGEYVARSIMAVLEKHPVPVYIPKPIAYNVGVGPAWSVFVLNNIKMHGFIAYIIRVLIDIRFFLSILPFYKVWKLYSDRKEISGN